MKKIILGIETSCDETGVALVEASGDFKSPRFKVLKNLVASQIKIHQPFGGVVPNLAKREHLKNLPILFGKIFRISNDPAYAEASAGRQFSISKKFQDSRFKIQDVDLIAVTVGPGLEPALWTGITFAKQIISNFQIPISKLVGVNHLEGHLYSFLLPSQKKRVIFNDQFSISKNIFPAVALIVSGGHTILLLVKDLKTWKHLGETRDDAVGEAFDKVARLLKLPYPGGSALEKLARRGNPEAVNFPRPMIYDKNFDFSFSGLKTSVLYYLRDHNRDTNIRMRANDTNNTNKKNLNPIPQTLMANIAASFQAAAIVKKTLRAVDEFSVNSIILSGGVAANSFLRNSLKKEAKKFGVDLLVAEQKYNTDNGVMIAVAGYMTYLRKKKYPMRANGNLGI